MAKVAKIKVNKNLKKAILEAVEAIGGFRKFIKKGEVVLLKPNFNTADPFPASTDFEFLKAGKVFPLLCYYCLVKIN